MSESRSAVLPKAGDMIDGKYMLERLIGQGGMGAVFAARHIKLGNACAIKLMLADASNPEASARFINEGRAAANIHNEHVVRVTDVDEEHGYAYMVLELLEGEDLSQVLERELLAPHVVAGYVLQALSGVADAHALGIVHRDLKPSNLFLTKRRDGSSVVKVLDFGISKAGHASGVLSQAPAARTSTKAMLGSPLYMSPEQLRSSKSVDARADIWAMGVILYELLTGMLPFGGENLGELFAAILETDPLPARTHRPEIPPGLEQIVSKCLQRRPEHRYQSAADLARELTPFAHPTSASPFAQSAIAPSSAGISAPMATALLAPNTNPVAMGAAPYVPPGGAPPGGAPMGGAPMGGASMGGASMGGAPMGPHPAPLHSAGHTTGSGAHVPVVRTTSPHAMTPQPLAESYPGFQTTGSSSRSGMTAVIALSALFFVIGAAGIGVYVVKRARADTTTAGSSSVAPADSPIPSALPSVPAPETPASVATAVPSAPASAASSATAAIVPVPHTTGAHHTSGAHTTGGHAKVPPKPEPKVEPPKPEPPKPVVAAPPPPKPKPTATSPQQNSR